MKTPVNLAVFQLLIANIATARAAFNATLDITLMENLALLVLQIALNATLKIATNVYPLNTSYLITPARLAIRCIQNALHAMEKFA